jgi:TonB family protein
MLLAAPLLRAQTPVLADGDVPVVARFVAPAYPRIAKDNRIMGTTVTDITVSAEGRVSDAKIISAHPVFANYVLSALRQWQFRASRAEYHLKVTVQFDLVDDCSDGTDKHPLTSTGLVGPGCH